MISYCLVMATESSKTRQQELVKLFSTAPIAKSMGMTLSYDDQDRAVFHMPYHAGFDHAMNGVHGGVFATLLDNAGWFTVAPYYATWIATVEFEVRLLEHVSGEALWSRGEIVRMGKNLTTAKMSVWTAEDRLVATGAGTFMVIPKVACS